MRNEKKNNKQNAKRTQERTTLTTVGRVVPQTHRQRRQSLGTIIQFCTDRTRDSDTFCLAKTKNYKKQNSNRLCQKAPIIQLNNITSICSFFMLIYEIEMIILVFVKCWSCCPSARGVANRNMHFPVSQKPMPIEGVAKKQTLKF